MNMHGSHRPIIVPHFRSMCLSNSGLAAFCQLQLRGYWLGQLAYYTSPTLMTLYLLVLPFVAPFVRPLGHSGVVVHSVPCNQKVAGLNLPKKLCGNLELVAHP